MKNRPPLLAPLLRSDLQGELLAELEACRDMLTEDQRVVVAWARRDYDKATRLPAAFVREKAEQGSRGYQAWKCARENNDFASYAPVLEKNAARSASTPKPAAKKARKKSA